MNASDIFFPKASFNKPVVKRSVENAKYAEIFWNYGGLMPAGKTLGDTLVPAMRNYGIPIYNMKDADTKVKVYQIAAYQSMYTISSTGVKYGAEVPYNMKWKAAEGTDRLMIIIDYDTGNVWELGGVLRDQPWNVFDSPFGFLGDWAKGPNGKAGFQYDNPKHIGVFVANNYKNLWTGTNINPTAAEKLAVVRGCGLPKSALTVRAARIASAIANGEKTLGHALPLSISITQHGDDATGKGTFVFPGTRLEHANGTKWQTRCGSGVKVPPNNQCVPQSAMLVLEPDFDIPGEIAKMGYKGIMARVMELLWNTAATEGILLGAETGCGPAALMQFEAFTPDSIPLYSSVGLFDDGSLYPNSHLYRNMLRRMPDGKLNFFIGEPPR